MKTYTITAITKANRTEYFHAVTVEAENIKEAKAAAAEIIESALNRHAFRLNNATAAVSVEYAQWIAERFNVTIEDVMQAASRPGGVDAYNFKPAEAGNPLTPGNAPLYAWTFANAAESAATLAAEASSHADAIQYARAARTCANEAAEAAKIAGTAEAAKDAARARIAADNAAEAAALSAYETARREANKAENADHRTRYAASILDSPSRAAYHAEEAERHAAAAEQAAHEAAAIADAARTSYICSIADSASEEANNAREAASDARETVNNIQTEATKIAARAADAAEQAAQEVASAPDICDADAADNRAQAAANAAADAADRYDADEATKAHAARAAQAAQEARAALINRVKNLTPQDAEAATSSDYAERLAIEAAEKAGADLEEFAAEHAAPVIVTPRAGHPIYAAHDSIVEACNRAFAEIDKEAAEQNAAEALADEAGADQQQREAARRVAYEELTGIKQASDADRETVSAMIEDIAARAAFEARRPSLEEIKAEFNNPFLVW